MQVKERNIPLLFLMVKKVGGEGWNNNEINTSKQYMGKQDDDCLIHCQIFFTPYINRAIDFYAAVWYINCRNYNVYHTF